MAEEKILKEIESVKVKGKTGVIIKADTLGSLEALTRIFSEKGFPIKKADIGGITKHDVVEAYSVKKSDPLHGIIIGFNVETEVHAAKEAKRDCVKIFSDNVIYSLLEKCEKYAEEEKKRLKDEKEGKVVLPAKFQFLKGFVFRRSKPAVFGVKVLAGRLRAGAKAMNETGKIVGRVECLQCKGESLCEAGPGEEVAVSLRSGVVGRNVSEGDIFFTFIPEKQFEAVCSLELTEEERGLLEEIRKLEAKEQEEVE